MSHEAEKRKQRTAVWPCAVYLRLRGSDSNRRPPGYEPDELPLLHPATLSSSEPVSRILSRAVIHLGSRVAPDLFAPYLGLGEQPAIVPARACSG